MVSLHPAIVRGAENFTTSHGQISSNAPIPSVSSNFIPPKADEGEPEYSKFKLPDTSRRTHSVCCSAPACRGILMLPRPPAAGSGSVWCRGGFTPSVN